MSNALLFYAFGVIAGMLASRAEGILDTVLVLFVWSTLVGVLHIKTRENT